MTYLNIALKDGEDFNFLHLENRNKDTSAEKDKEVR